MSATPGKRVKKKAKTLTLSEFMGSGDTDASPLSTPQGQFSKARRDGDIILPQGPRASGRVEVDLSRLAPDPPYHLLISNMSYDADEPRLREHLGNIKEMDEVTWNYKDGRRDGSAFVEFKTREGAVAALGQSDTIFSGRKVVISVAERNAEGELVKEGQRDWRRRESDSPWQHDMYPRTQWRDNRSRYRFSDQGEEDSKDDWRSRPSQAPDREGFRSGGFHGGRYRGRGGRREEDRDMSPHSGAHSPDGYRRFSQGGEYRRPSRGRGRYDSQDTPELDTGSWRRGGSENPVSSLPVPLPDDLAPREQSSPAKNIFGGAKPVDTSAREREMEKKMAQMALQSPSASLDADAGDGGRYRQDSSGSRGEGRRGGRGSRERREDRGRRDTYGGGEDFSENRGGYERRYRDSPGDGRDEREFKNNRNERNDRFSQDGRDGRGSRGGRGRFEQRDRDGGDRFERRDRDDHRDRRGREEFDHRDRRGREEFDHRDRRGREEFDHRDRQGREEFVRGDRQGREEFVRGDRQGREEFDRGDSQGRDRDTRGGYDPRDERGGRDGMERRDRGQVRPQGERRDQRPPARAVYQESEQPDFARDTRFSLLEADDQD